MANRPPHCNRCARHVPTEQEILDFEEWTEANRQIDHFEFSAPPQSPFCVCPAEGPISLAETSPWISIDDLYHHRSCDAYFSMTMM